MTGPLQSPGPSSKLIITALLLLGFLQHGATQELKELLRLDCNIEQYHVLCMELVDDGQPSGGRGITTPRERDVLALDVLTRRINGARDFLAEGFLNSGSAGTLEEDTVGRTNYRIDQQVSSPDYSWANIQYQVGSETKASCQIRYNPRSATPCNLRPRETPCNRQGTTPIPQNYATRKLHQHFEDGQVKRRVQDGLDYSIRNQNQTELRWRIATPIPTRERIYVNGKRRKETKKEAVGRALRAHYGNDILEREFAEIRPSDRSENKPRKIAITDKFANGK